MTPDVEPLWAHWQPGTVIDPVGLENSIGVVAERVCADGTVKPAVRLLLGWLCEGKQQDVLARLTAPAHLPPEMAREQDVRDAAFAAGVEAACDILTNQDQLREVRSWLNSKEPETEDARPE